MKLEDLEVYQLAMELGEAVWKLRENGDPFVRRTFGAQWVRACDSVAANISEGFGRYHFRENRQFCYYARGSLYETKTWLQKAHRRGYVSDVQHQALQGMIEQTGIKLNNYIRSIGKGTLKK